MRLYILMALGCVYIDWYGELSPSIIDTKLLTTDTINQLIYHIDLQ